MTRKRTPTQPPTQLQVHTGGTLVNKRQVAVIKNADSRMRESESEREREGVGPKKAGRAT